MSCSWRKPSVKDFLEGLAGSSTDLHTHSAVRPRKEIHEEGEECTGCLKCYVRWLKLLKDVGTVDQMCSFGCAWRTWKVRKDAVAETDVCLVVARRFPVSQHMRLDTHEPIWTS